MQASSSEVRAIQCRPGEARPDQFGPPENASLQEGVPQINTRHPTSTKIIAPEVPASESCTREIWCHVRMTPSPPVPRLGALVEPGYVCRICHSDSFNRASGWDLHGRISRHRTSGPRHRDHGPRYATSLPVMLSLEVGDASIGHDAKATMILTERPGNCKPVMRGLPPWSRSRAQDAETRDCVGRWSLTPRGERASLAVETIPVVVNRLL